MKSAGCHAFAAKEFGQSYMALYQARQEGKTDDGGIEMELEKHRWPGSAFVQEVEVSLLSCRRQLWFQWC